VSPGPQCGPTECVARGRSFGAGPGRVPSRFAVPPSLAPRTVSWCGEFDGTCTAQWHMSIFQLLPFCEQLRQFPWCSTRHTDYDFWAHQSAMAEAVGAVVRRAGWQPAT